MNRIKRWTSGLVVQIDRLMAQVENHEALADSVIAEVRRAAARARVQMSRVRQDGERLRRQLATQRAARARWQERARAADDKERAIECLRRSRRAAGLVPQLESRLELHQQAEKQLEADVALVEQRLERLNEQRNLMRTRQSRAEALSSAREVGESDVDDVFDRWETRVTELEIEGGGSYAVDPLELEYAEAEEREELLAELAELEAQRS